MNPRKILIITYYWPPSGGVGVQRWMNFSLQLKSRGWEPIILTPENPQFAISDEQQLRKVEDIVVHKVPIWEPFDLFHKITGNQNRKNVQQGLVLEKSSKSFNDKLTVWIRGNLLLPDPRVFWVKKAADFATNLIRNEEINAVITTGPPHSIHLIGRRLKRKIGVKWLADFRDPWSKWDILQKLQTSEIALSIHRKLERTVLKEADQVVTVSSRLADSLGNARVLNNGITISKSAESKPEEGYFTIGYFGMLNELRNPTQFWLMLDQLCREDLDFGKKLRIKIGGIVSESIKEELGQLHELDGKVEYLGYLPHEQVQEEYKKCNLLLLLLNKSDNSEWILPVKFFEYLGAGRMILCFGKRSSDLGDLMNSREIGEILSFTAIEEMRNFVLEVFQNDQLPDKDDVQELLEKFSHKRLTNTLEEILKDLNE